jgi:hypothetical protein
MGTTQLASGPLFLSLFSLFSLHACGGEVSPDRQSSTAGGTGGSVANHTGAGGLVLAVAGGAAGVGVTGTAGTSGPVCPVEGHVGAPTLSTDCQIVVRRVDPALTCESTDCAITKALDLTCAYHPGKPWISATADGAVVLVRTDDSDKYEALARLMTVEAADSRVEDVPALATPNNVDRYFSILDSAMATNSSGAKWLFAGEAPGITAVRGTDAGWTRATVLPSPDPDYGVVLTDASMVDDRLGYLTYSTWLTSAPHLVTWDGSCWTDQPIGETHAWSMVVETDAEKRPWVAWVSDPNSLYLRNPSGDTQNLLAKGTTDTLSIGFMYSSPLRLLPGGLDGTAAIPAVAAMFNDGIRVLSNSPTTDSGWLSLVLPESGAFSGADDCPSEQPSYDNGNHCVGMATCTQQSSRVGSGFDLARTPSGAVFAAWVMYSSQGTYALQETFTSGEMPQRYCGRTETSGSGTADLVVARLTESEPILSHFRFDLGGAALSGSRDVVMVARGDTLVVAAFLSGDLIPTLTYLEIDSRLLS